MDVTAACFTVARELLLQLSVEATNTRRRPKSHGVYTRSRKEVPCPGDVTIASGLTPSMIPLMVIGLVRERRFAAHGRPITAL